MIITYQAIKSHQSDYNRPKAAKSLGIRVPIISTPTISKDAQPETAKEGEKTTQKNKKVLDTGKLVKHCMNTTTYS